MRNETVVDWPVKGWLSKMAGSKGLPMATVWRAGEAAIVLLGLIFTCRIIFSSWLLGARGGALAFLVIPIMIWTSLRFGARGVIFASLIILAFAIFGTAQETGPFAFPNRLTSFAVAVAFVAVVACMGFFLASDSGQRHRSDVALRKAEERYAQLLTQLEQLNQEQEHRVQERTVQLEAVNRELEAFCYSISHDLRAPLRSIRGFSEVLLERYAQCLDARGQEFLRRACESTEAMDRLIEDLLKLSRLTRVEVQRRPVNLSALAESVADELHKSEPERNVEFVIPPDLKTEGDERLLRVALDNLLRNAWKFTNGRPGARIEVGLTSQEPRAFFVRDNGVGFDMAFATKLFKVFQRLHSATQFPGSGVGLATVQRIVNKHGGRTWATGEVNQGATFYFTLSPAGN
jgi:signal transduction histidine kinase